MRIRIVAGAMVILFLLIPDQSTLLQAPHTLLDLDKTFAGIGSGINKRTPMAKEKYEYSWGLERVNAPQAWKILEMSKEVVVAVIDSGIDRHHPALEGRIWINEGEIPGNGVDDDLNGFIDDIHGWDFQDGDADSLSGTSIHMHGTFGAGLIAGLINESGIGGVAPNVKLMDLRILNSKNRFKHRDWSELSRAIHYAIDNGADIINMSFTSSMRPPGEFYAAIKRASEENVMMVGSAGNSASDVQYPARFEEVIAVGAIDLDNSIADYSNFGSAIDLAAPGTNVESILPGNQYGTGSGTSWAAAHVSGSIALILSMDPNIALTDLMNRIRKSAIDLGPLGKDETFGVGLIDAAALVSVH